MSNKIVERYFLQFLGLDYEIRAPSLKNAISLVKSDYCNSGVKDLIVRKYEVVSEETIKVDTTYGK